MSSEQALEIVVQRQSARQLDPAIADKVIEEMKSSAILSISWEDLIVSAPVALSCLGACFVASSSEKAEGIKVPMVAGATVQRTEHLSGNLTDCANLGINAFNKAETGLLKIRQLSVQTQNTIADVVECLADPILAQKYLQTYMIDIKNSADKCYSTSKEMDDQFTAWLTYVQELNTACVEKKSTVVEKTLANELKKATEECRLIQTEEVVKAAKKTAEDLGKTLDAATAAYTKASDNFPTGWEIISQQLVSGLSDCLTTALNQAIPALVDNLNPIAKAKAAAGLIKGFTDKGDGEKKVEASSPDGSTQGGQTKLPPAVEARDPAYAQLARDLYLFDALNGILSSPNGGNWKSTEVTKEKPNSGINFIYTMLEDSLTSFSKLASNQAASVQYKQILADSVKIAQEILDEAKKADSSLSYEKPGKDDPRVKKWQEVFETLYSDTYALNTKGQQLPGNSANPSPLYPSSADQTAQINAKTQQAQVLLDAASKRLTTTSETLKATTESYQEASKQLVEQQTVLANIKAELTKLTKENMELDEIKIVLVQCIKLIINLKSQITNLVRFFSAVATTIDVVVSKTVTKFLKTVSIAVSADPAALGKGNLKVGNYSLLDAERSMIYQGALTVSAYFGLFADVGTMWRDVSKDHIFPGIALVGQISASAGQPGEMKKNVKILETWSDKAQSSIRECCKAKREEILNGMYERIEDVSSTIKQLPAGTVPKQIQSVIEKTAKEVGEATKQEIVAAAEYKPINWPSLRRKE